VYPGASIDRTAKRAELVGKWTKADKVHGTLGIYRVMYKGYRFFYYDSHILHHTMSNEGRTN